MTAKLEETLRGLGEYRNGLRRDLKAVSGEIARAAKQAHAAGVPKVRICELAGISRPTLDEMLAR